MNKKLQILLSPKAMCSRFMWHTAKYWPDKLYCQMLSWIITGHGIDLKNPVTYNDKLNWLKLYYHKPEFTTMVDKYAVKQYVSEIIGAEYVIPAYGVYPSFDSIDFEKLPNKFMLKCTHDSGSFAICRDKGSFNMDDARQRLEKGLNRTYYYINREWPYKNCPPRIVAEELVEELSHPETVIEYKVTTCNGKVKFITVCTGEAHGPVKGRTNDHFDVNWNPLDFVVVFDHAKGPVKKPKDLQKLIEMSEKLSEGTPYLRVDWYDINDKLLFGELTFYTWGGTCKFIPWKWNKIIGDWITLPEPTEK